MAHALLSPSAAHRWLHCPVAPRLEATVKDESSIFAQEGTLAHAYCAKKLKQFLGQSTEGEEQEIAELNEQFHTGEMDEYTDTYKTIVLEKLTEARTSTADAQLLVETRLDFGKYVPEAFGTADAIIIADGLMEVIDFKYGKGVRVDAVENPQMMIYALGAYRKFSLEYDIRQIRMTIVQPRIDNLSEWMLPVEDLKKWAKEVLKPNAEKAFKGEGEPAPGDWCKFCKVKSGCRALANLSMSTAKKYSTPSQLSSEELAKNVLPVLDTIKTWISGVEAYVLEQALAGEVFKGYKIVEGRSVRKITDPTSAIEALRGAGFADETILKPTELKTITDLEKAVGKKLFSSLVGDYITKPQGRPTLVPETDKRPAFNAAADDFKNINL